MAAKVVMVAVPTVLGIASIRVYTVREVSADGLVSREKLNVYTPLPQSAEAHFVPETPGVIQSGLTTAREGVLPFALAVKGACVSVKRGSVNLYNSAEDVYYYLKDPPPEFLPRFGTITMAGLLGMFLARKGSRLRRVAVPLGLMSAGASVCYPAQAVAVLKLTGKKVYAAGQWSSAAVSSLLTPKPRAPVTKETATSQTQDATVPNPQAAVAEEASEPRSTADGSALSSVVLETEVESAESGHVSEEAAVHVISEEASSDTPAEITHHQTPADTNADPIEQSAPTETGDAATLDSKQAAEEVSTNGSPAGSAPSSEPEVLEAAPIEEAPKEAPEEAAPVEAAPEEAAPVEAAPEEAAPVEAAPVEAAPVEAAPVEAAPVEAAPVEAAPEEAAPEEAAPEEAAPEEAAPVEAAPEEAAPVEAAPEEAAPEEAAPEEAAPVEAAPVEAAPVEAAPVEAAPLEAPASSAEVESSPASEEPPPEVPFESSAPDVESAAAERASDAARAASVEDTPAPTLTPPLPEQPSTQNSKGGSGFTPDPALLDFGQSNPEDEDLYSTRS